MIAIIILAAGSSSRMRGRDKLLEDIDGIPLLRRTVLRAAATGMAITVALPAAPHPRYAAVAGLGVKVVPVAEAQQGMGTSLRAAIASLPPDTRAVMVMLADMPDLTSDDLDTILHVVDLNSETLIWRATTQDGAAGHPTVFRDTLFAALKAVEGDTGGSAVVKTHSDQTLLVSLPDTHARTDLDTPEDWAEWRRTRKLI